MGLFSFGTDLPVWSVQGASQQGMQKKQIKEQPLMNSSEFLNKDSSNVRPDERFFYKVPPHPPPPSEYGPDD